nr:family 1 glycosylhydrolase [Enterococcus faecium]
MADLWNNNMFLDPAIKGEFSVELLELLTKDGVLWQSTADDLALIKENTVDFIGVYFYHPNRVKTTDIAPNSVTAWMPDRYYDAYQIPDLRMNIDKGWQIYPKAVYDIAINISDSYGNIPLFISENGMEVYREERIMDEKGHILDDYRIDFFKEHL